MAAAPAAGAPAPIDWWACEFVVVRGADVTIDRPAHRLGSGSWAEVWGARHNEQQVAQKFFTLLDTPLLTERPGMTQTELDLVRSDRAFVYETMRTECAIMAKLDSLYIVRFFGLSLTANNQPQAILMELLTPLVSDALYRRGRPLNLVIWQAVALHVALGLEVLAKQNVIHRDLKPENILYDAETGIFKIADLGLARVKRHSTMISKSGTLVYLPPEVSDEALPKTSQWDIFSFGVTMMELALGRDPAPTAERRNGQLVPEIERRQRDVAELATISPVVDQLVKKCLPDDAVARATPRQIISLIGTAIEGRLQSPPGAPLCHIASARSMIIHSPNDFLPTGSLEKALDVLRSAILIEHKIHISVATFMGVIDMCLNMSAHMYMPCVAHCVDIMKLSLRPIDIGVIWKEPDADSAWEIILACSNYVENEVDAKSIELALSLAGAATFGADFLKLMSIKSQLLQITNLFDVVRAAMQFKGNREPGAAFALGANIIRELNLKTSDEWQYMDACTDFVNALETYPAFDVLIFLSLSSLINDNFSLIDIHDKRLWAACCEAMRRHPDALDVQHAACSIIATRLSNSTHLPDQCWELFHEVTALALVALTRHPCESLVKTIVQGLLPQIEFFHRGMLELHNVPITLIKLCIGEKRAKETLSIVLTAIWRVVKSSSDWTRHCLCSAGVGRVSEILPEEDHADVIYETVCKILGALLDQSFDCAAEIHLLDRAVSRLGAIVAAQGVRPSCTSIFTRCIGATVDLYDWLMPLPYDILSGVIYKHFLDGFAQLEFGDEICRAVTRLYAAGASSTHLEQLMSSVVEIPNLSLTCVKEISRVYSSGSYIRWGLSTRNVEGLVKQITAAMARYSRCDCMQMQGISALKTILTSTSKKFEGNCNEIANVIYSAMQATSATVDSGCIVLCLLDASAESRLLYFSPPQTTSLTAPMPLDVILQAICTADRSKDNSAMGELFVRACSTQRGAVAYVWMHGWQIILNILADNATHTGFRNAIVSACVLPQCPSVVQDCARGHDSDLFVLEKLTLLASQLAAHFTDDSFFVFVRVLCQLKKYLVHCGQQLKLIFKPVLEIWLQTCESDHIMMGARMNNFIYMSEFAASVGCNPVDAAMLEGLNRLIHRDVLVGPHYVNVDLNPTPRKAESWAALLVPLVECARRDTDSIEYEKQLTQLNATLRVLCLSVRPWDVRSMHPTTLRCFANKVTSVSGLTPWTVSDDDIMLACFTAELRSLNETLVDLNEQIFQFVELWIMEIPFNDVDIKLRSQCRAILQRMRNAFCKGDVVPWYIGTVRDDDGHEKTALWQVIARACKLHQTVKDLVMSGADILWHMYHRYSGESAATKELMLNEFGGLSSYHTFWRSVSLPNNHQLFSIRRDAAGNYQVESFPSWYA